jgi:hypothetical protein
MRGASGTRTTITVGSSLPGAGPRKESTASWTAAIEKHGHGGLDAPDATFEIGDAVRQRESPTVPRRDVYSAPGWRVDVLTEAPKKP